MAVYELTVIAASDVAATKSIPSGKEALDALLSKASVQVLEKTDWGSKKLWHPINKQPDASFVHYIVEANPDSISGLTNELNITGNIYRSYFIKKAAKTKRSGRPKKDQI